MKKQLLLALAFISCSLSFAQTMNVNIGDVTYAIPASQAGEMTYTDGTVLTIGSKTYPISAITNITIDDSSVTDNTVDVTYSDNTAKVRIAGNIAQYIDAQVNGGHVTIAAAPTLASDVTYNMSGNSANGSFYMTGDYKMNMVLNGLTLANPDSAAINIQNGKQINVVLADGTSNSLADGLRTADDDSDGHKAVFYVEGHTSWTGGGSLTITGNVKHGFFSDEYTELLNGLGSITVTQAPSDGLHVNQYFRMQGGTVAITCTGDGIDVGAKKSEKENNGEIMIEGGTLTVNTSGNATKGLKCDTNMSISGGTNTINTTGSAIYESAENDLSSCAALKCDGVLTISGGTNWFASTGDGGKGINSTGVITVSGGTTTVVTTGSVFEYGTLDTKPHAVKSDANIVLSGGSILACASSDSGTAFKTDLQVLTNGATLMGVGGKATTGATSSSCTSYKYSGVNVTGGSTLSYNNVSFTIPSIYNNSSAKVIVSRK